MLFTELYLPLHLKIIVERFEQLATTEKNAKTPNLSSFFIAYFSRSRFSPFGYEYDL